MSRVPIISVIARSVHVTTREPIIRRFLLLGVGDPCNELRRAESERILRAQPFLADASILVLQVPGGVELNVRTVDETSLLIGARFAARWQPLRAFKLGNANLSGTAILVAGEWRDGGAYRDWLGIRVEDHQFLGRPWILAAEARQRSLGGDWRVESEHPFYTDLQRIAWRGRGGSSDDYVRFEPQPGVIHGVHLLRRFFDVGGIIRVGPPGRLSLFGASLTGDDEQPDDVPVLITDSGLATDTSSLLAGRWRPHRVARSNLLWGVRDIAYLRVRGFDALTAVQDIPLGFQLGTLVGRSLSVLGARDDDLFMSADVYIGAGTPRALTRLQVQAEGRRDNKANAWDGILTSGRIGQYVHVSPNDLLVASGEWSGAWRQRIPFAFTLGVREGGVRGFHSAAAPGGQRAVVRLEHRHYGGQVFRWADAGYSLFTDAGRLWAGDVPYGVSTPVRASVGVGLLAAVPPRSARLWRLDLAVPVTKGQGRGIELRLSSSERTAFLWREPVDVQMARERTVPSSIFGWP